VVKAESSYSQSGGFAHSLHAFGVLEQGLQTLRERGGISRWHNKTIQTIGHNTAAIWCGDDWQTVCHGLELGECEAIRDRGENKNIGLAVEFPHTVAGYSAVESHIGRGFYNKLVGDGDWACDVDLDVLTFQETGGFEEVLDTFAEVDLAEEKHAKRLGVRS
jgi:hypothetical protein